MTLLIKKALFVGFIALAGAIYTTFSHGVTSVFMSYAFIWVLVGFILKALIDRFLPRRIKKNIKHIHVGLWLSYMINATLGSISIGIITIAGSYTNFLYIQLSVGLISLALYLLLSLVLLWSSH
ncbi:MAG: hypothetical protein LRY28_02640 [Erysipelotrichaceae bacterium]|nr:hypothetical protein [Erysipelotrichaceae bacterium]